MKRSTSFLLAALTLAALASTRQVSPNFEIPQGYIAGVLHITGDIDGIPLNHTGTVQEVFAQLGAQNKDFNISDLNALESLSDIDEQLNKRKATDVLCWPVSGQNWEEANGPAVIQGLDYLRMGDKRCHVGAATCVRVSCRWNSGIFFCNNNNYPLAPRCKLIADYGSSINNKCRWQHEAWQTHRVGGQAFDSMNWNVYIRKDVC